MTVAGPGLAQLPVRIVEPEVVASAEVAHTGGGLEVVVGAGEHQLVPGGRLEVVGAALAVRVVGGIVGGLEDSALPRVEADGGDGLTRGSTGGRAERLPVEHEPPLGGLGGGEVDGEAGGGGDGEDEEHCQDTGTHLAGLFCPLTEPASYTNCNSPVSLGSSNSRIFPSSCGR